MMLVGGPIQCTMHSIRLRGCLWQIFAIGFLFPWSSASDLDVVETIFQKTTNLTACTDDIVNLCGDHNGVLPPKYKGVYGVLSCVANHFEKEDQVSADCQNEIWSFKYQLTNTNQFSEVTKIVCKTLLLSNRDCLEAETENDVSPGAMTLSCLIDRVQPNVDHTCGNYLHLMEMVVFSDYRLVHKFASVCEPYIRQYNCGRLSSLHDNAQELHSQANTIECMQDHLEKLPGDCLHEILRISELQSDDFHLDKPLYFACRNDRETYCKDVESGQGQVYRCLMNNKHQTEMSEACKNKLMQRERIIAQDYKVSKSLVRACKTDIKRYQCRANTSNHKEVRLSQILLCLENAQSKSLPLMEDCRTELLVHRRSLIDDYRLTPSMINACQYDIAEFCGNVGGAHILHCLMRYAHPKRRRGDDHNKKRISAQCNREIEVSCCCCCGLFI